MRPKQAVLNNNIQMHSSQTGSSEEYRIREPNSRVESVITRHVSAIGGKKPPYFPHKQPVSARQNTPLQSQSPFTNPEFISNSNASNLRGQSTLPYYNYNNSNNYLPRAQNSTINYNNLSLQPNQTFYYQDLNTGQYYVPVTDYNNQYPTSYDNYTYPQQSTQYAPNTAPAIQYQNQIAPQQSVQYAPNTTPAIQYQTQITPQQQFAQYPTNTLPYTNPVETSLSLVPVPAPNYNPNAQLSSYSPEPITSLFNYKPINTIDTLNERLDELELDPFIPVSKKPEVIIIYI